MKKQKRNALIIIAIGAVMALLAALTCQADDSLSGMLSSMASIMIAIGAVRLLRLRRLASNPEKAAEYEASLKDERTVYIANKARSLTFAISVLVEWVIGMAAMYILEEQVLGLVLSYLVCGQCLLFTALYYYYCKKY